MAGFHPRTFELLRADLARETGTHERDTKHLTRFKAGSQNQMAELLRERVAAFPDVEYDLNRLLRFMQGVNEAAEEVAERVELLRLVEPCEPADLGPGYKGGSLRPDKPEPAAAEVLSRTPLAVAFGDAEPARPTATDMRAIFGEPVEGRDYDVMPGGEPR